MTHRKGRDGAIVSGFRDSQSVELEQIMSLHWNISVYRAYVFMNRKLTLSSFLITEWERQIQVAVMCTLPYLFSLKRLDASRRLDDRDRVILVGDITTGVVGRYLGAPSVYHADEPLISLHIEEAKGHELNTVDTCGKTSSFTDSHKLGSISNFF